MWIDVKMPIMYELSGKKVLVIGGGKTAYRLIIKLKEFYASVICVSKAFEPKVSKLKSITCVEEIMRHNAINTDHFTNIDVVITSTNNVILNEKIYQYCKENRILCMTTHKKGPKDFDIMESKEKNGLLLAVSTQAFNIGLSDEILTKFMDSIDAETFTRLEMLIEEKKLLVSIKNK